MRRERLNPDWISVKQAADLKEVSTKAVYKQINAGNLTIMRAGEVTLVLRRDVDAWKVDHTKQVRKGQKAKTEVGI